MYRPEPEEIDVRSLDQAGRYEMMLQVVDKLAPGDHFTLLNDRDPEPLLCLLEVERPGEFWWSDVGSDAKSWRSEIGRYPIPPLH